MKNKIYIPLLFSFALILGIILGGVLNYPKNKTSLFFNKNQHEEKIKRLIDYIQYDYVDKVETDSLLDGAINNILEKLDPHSVYIPASEHDGINERMNGEFVGIGIQFRFYKDSLTVIRVIEDGPSEKAGIKAGDRILIANKDTLFDRELDNAYIFKTLKGKPQTKVALKIYRKSEQEIIDFTIKRGRIPIKSIDAVYMLNESLGYIKINKFASTTYKEFKTGLTSLLEQNMTHLVLDLRGNPGGYLDIATQIIDEFLEDDKLIVFTKNKGGKIDKTFATKRGDFENSKLYVLIDENSASASEIVAGALQDNDKGVIVGRRSFGKGLVQQEMDLGDGSAVRLTVARYYTPTGRSIQKPYDGENGANYYNDRLMRIHNGELINADSIKVNDSLRYVTPKGKVVYGGGGIVPDVFVGIDTTAYYGRFHYAKMNDFVFDYVDNHRKKVNSWTLDSFENNFEKEAIFKQYLNIIEEETINPQAYENSNLKRYLRALFAQHLFEGTIFYKILNEKDKMLAKVLELEKQSEKKEM